MRNYLKTRVGPDTGCKKTLALRSCCSRPNVMRSTTEHRPLICLLGEIADRAKKAMAPSYRIADTIVEERLAKVDAG